MSVNFYTGANQVIVKNTLTDELKTSYDDAVELVNKLGGDATVEGSVAQRIAAIVANAPEKYDTLKEIATWIESDTDGAAKMQADIATLETDKLDKTSVSSWAKASTKPEYTASEINMANGTNVESTISTLNLNMISRNRWFLNPKDSITISCGDASPTGNLILFSSFMVIPTYKTIFFTTTGNGNNTNPGQHVDITMLKESSIVTVSRVDQSGSYNNIIITNNGDYEVYITANTLFGTPPSKVS